MDYSRVSIACEHLLSEGIKPTIRGGVEKGIGGSFRDLVPLVNEWLQNQESRGAARVHRAVAAYLSLDIQGRKDYIERVGLREIPVPRSKRK